jgi:predicted RNase H-like HicB family nuclease
MTTLIAVYNSEGCVGRCDAKCYNASSPDCDCVCQGANHGAGLMTAMANTQEMAETWLEDAKANHLAEFGEELMGEIGNCGALQPPLFAPPPVRRVAEKQEVSV